jgi:hypothetical protein
MNRHPYKNRRMVSYSRVIFPFANHNKPKTKPTIMKKITLLLFTIAAFLTSYSQDLPDFDAIKLEVKEDFNENANNAALQAANYIFSIPVEKKNATRRQCALYMIKWMSGSPDFHFTLDAEGTKFLIRDADLMILYLAAMTKYALENKVEAADNKKVQLNAVKTVIQYVKVPANKIKPNKEMKKAIEADEKGQLAEFLKL